MGVERYSQIINATGRAELARGNFFLLLTATGLVNVRADRDGSSEGFNGIVGGFVIKRVRPWDQMIVVGAAGVTIEYVVGSENISEDETDIRLGVSAVAGTVSTSDLPSSAISDLPPVVVADASEETLFAANPSRRRVRVFADALNPGSCFVKAIATTGEFIAELQAGTVHEFKTIDTLFVENVNLGADATFYIFEES